MNTPLEIVQDYCNRGFQPIPVPYGKKRPLEKNWPNLRFDAEGAKAYFNGSLSNIGVLLGNPSNGLVDIDLDCPEAIRLAPQFLPITAMFGRESAPCSHWLYQCKTPGARRAFAVNEGMSMVVEYRSTGGQTVFPGSTHPGGEIIRWDKDCKPMKIDSVKLRNKVAKLAVGAVLLRYWVKGMRDELATALAGFLLRGLLGLLHRVGLA